MSPLPLKCCYLYLRRIQCYDRCITNFDSKQIYSLLVTDSLLEKLNYFSNAFSCTHGL